MSIFRMFDRKKAKQQVEQQTREQALAMMVGHLDPDVDIIRYEDLPSGLEFFIADKSVLDVIRVTDTVYFLHTSKIPGECSNCFVAYLDGHWYGLPTKNDPMLQAYRAGLVLRVHGPDWVPAGDTASGLSPHLEAQIRRILESTSQE